MRVHKRALPRLRTMPIRGDEVYTLATERKFPLREFSDGPIRLISLVEEPALCYARMEWQRGMGLADIEKARRGARNRPASGRAPELFACASRLYLDERL